MNARLLSDLAVHATAFVGRLRGDALLRERLVELGFTPGQRIEVLSQAAFGGPVQVRVRGGTIAVRRDEAACVEVDGGVAAIPASAHRAAAVAAA
jgi:Fe2+ transport system protein FeoA